MNHPPVITRNRKPSYGQNLFLLLLPRWHPVGKSCSLPFSAISIEKWASSPGFGITPGFSEMKTKRVKFAIKIRWIFHRHQSPEIWSWKWGIVHQRNGGLALLWQSKLEMLSPKGVDNIMKKNWVCLERIGTPKTKTWFGSSRWDKPNLRKEESWTGTLGWLRCFTRTSRLQSST